VLHYELIIAKQKFSATDDFQSSANFKICLKQEFKPQYACKYIIINKIS